MKNKGFTLIELMIVVAIIAILAAVGIIKFGSLVRKSHDSRGLAELGTLRTASALYYIDNQNIDTSNTGGLIESLYVKNKFNKFAYGDSLKGTETFNSHPNNLFIQVGTSDTIMNNKKYIILNYSTTSESIKILASNGKNTNNEDWLEF